LFYNNILNYTVYLTILCIIKKTLTLNIYVEC